MKWLEIQQNTDIWHIARLGKITSSNLDDIMVGNGEKFGETAFKYALQLALERINQKSSVNQIKTFHMKRGHEQEPIAISLYESQYFVEVKHGGFFDCGFYGDSPDGLVGVDGVIEVKSVTAPVHYATLTRGNYDPTFYWQMIGHIDCSNRDWCDFISYCADFPEDTQILVYRMHRHQVEQEIEILRERREKFNEYVEQIKQKILSSE